MSAFQFAANPLNIVSHNCYIGLRGLKHPEACIDRLDGRFMRGDVAFGRGYIGANPRPRRSARGRRDDERDQRAKRYSPARSAIYER